jgi:hypothetical protein
MEVKHKGSSDYGRGCKKISEKLDFNWKIIFIFDLANIKVDSCLIKHRDYDTETQKDKG